ncbi:MAG TPA: methylated-DNA--[protein]-cysteine S-methyltransferase [Caldisericia bacterium]|nr:methylated-DNA--[protein]-cysteine S-methyltransferase [Caldisericia bacterium]HPF49396.1 methylated-DNA--[protein]-cysteine S-methyltransferase [Caldisericia bacterium]HPI84401.1 methylated-DNA--[protein]-cysteine S-methyltransferase [Caldisericia bacterium]HPQ93567.1 methylated-DNA--[protein]-cysteine S-methyltransferase [Caldisericia bacterium]HRV75536.1 methylated-DNA--[protein]-cysteine S-methyltransferase [Caldisericia bacterium]
MSIKSVFFTDPYWFSCEDEDGFLVRLLPTEFREEQINSDLAREVKKQLTEYLESVRKVFDLPLKFYGTPFKKDVWEATRKVLYGETATYSDVADISGHPGAQRAVGNALHVSPILIIVPCHRVVAASHAGNYAYGMGMKKHLLELERDNS